MNKIHIIGAGLLGGSIALALAEVGWLVSIEDQTPELTANALRKLGLSNAPIDKSEIDIVAIAVPISVNANTIDQALVDYPNAIIIEISSVKTKSLPNIETNLSKYSRFVSTHPFAGKETHGAENANVALFQDRVWAICEGAYLTDQAKVAAYGVLKDCGAIAVEIDLLVHDKVVGYTSHLPQIISTLLSTQMQTLPEDLLRLSGNGLVDMTRLSLSSGEIWSDIVLNNAKNLLAILEEMKNSITTFQDSLRKEDLQQIRTQFEFGRAQKKRLPGKHGEVYEDFAKIEVQILDKPGELAQLFMSAYHQNINIEDIRINHALGRDLAILEIYVAKTDELRFAESLLSEGWQVRSILNRNDM